MSIENYPYQEMSLVSMAKTLRDDSLSGMVFLEELKLIKQAETLEKMLKKCVDAKTTNNKIGHEREAVQKELTQVCQQFDYTRDELDRLQAQVDRLKKVLQTLAVRKQELHTHESNLTNEGQKGQLLTRNLVAELKGYLNNRNNGFGKLELEPTHSASLKRQRMEYVVSEP